MQNGVLSLSIILSGLYLLTIIIVVSLIFIERRSVYSTIGWVLVLILIPFGGLFLYILFGRRILKDKKLVLKKNEDEALKQCLSKPKVDSNNLLHHDVEIRHSDMITMFDSLGASTFTSGNDVELYSESNEFFDSLLNALNNAKKSINIQFYIFKDDTIGSKIIEVLEEKQREGVRVKVLYDAMGSRSLSEKSFEKLISYGGQVASFLSSKIKMLNVNLNYRNHRKLVIIDGG